MYLTAYRSEKMHRRIESKKEMINSRIFEQIYEKTIGEYRKDLEDRIKKLKKLPFDDFSIQDICEILEYEQHSSYLANYIWQKLSPLQKDRVQIYQADLKVKLKNFALDEMKMTDSAEFSSMIKFRIVDFEEPNKTAMVTWYQPSEDFIDSVKEGKVIEFNGASASGINLYEEVSIYGGSKCKYTIKQNNCHEKFQSFMRVETMIREINVDEFKPRFGELDIVCMIIRVDKHEADKGSQQVFVVDDDKNFLVIKFLPSVSEYALDNVIKAKAIFFVRNLQWRKKSNEICPSIPETIATVDTSFLVNPGNNSHRLRLREFEASVNDNYFKDCAALLEDIVPSK